MPKAWSEFEQQVASLLGDFGYLVEHDTKIHGAQTDVFARSQHPRTPSLLVECKYHRVPESKVGIDDVENFIARVITLRNAGEVDRGYLVTNTGFTSDAKATLVAPQCKFVFLVTYNQFLSGLLNADSYLKNVIRLYEETEIRKVFVDLRTVDTTGVSGTIFDANIGPWDLNSDKGGVPFASVVRRQRSWILPQEELATLTQLGCVTKLPGSSGYKLNWSAFKSLRKEKQKARRQSAKHQVERDHAEHDHLVNTVDKAREQFALEVVGRLDRADDEKAIQLLKVDAPNFSQKFLEHIAPQKPPLRARQIWERCLEASRQQPKMPALEFEGSSPTAAADLTENASAIATESDSVELVLLPMQSAVISLLDFLSDSDGALCVLLGDYGAGKSTIMQRLMWQLARTKMQSSTDPSIRIPLLLNLRDYNKVADFARLIRGFLTDEADMGDLSLPMFRKLNASGYFIMLLDGFDEMLERVTKPDRRRCFLEIAQFLGGGAKVILSGRPGYFPDHKELSEVLTAMGSGGDFAIKRKNFTRRVFCLQLMDGHELQQFLDKSETGVSAKTKALIESNSSLYDLARRPVLSAMIMGSATDLAEADKKEISIRDLYEIYTNKWVLREQDKKTLRILIDPDKKSTFLRYLAMKMHLAGTLTIAFTELGREIQKHFNLPDIDTMDHFSHDIRTCSFLNRSDDGNYQFVHKSFMEYHVALEFERGEDSPFADSFNKPLLEEMIAFLKPGCSGLFRILLQVKETVETLLDEIKNEKEAAFKTQDFEGAASARDAEKKIQNIRQELKQDLYATMRYGALVEEVVTRLQAVARGVVSNSVRTRCETMVSGLTQLIKRS